MTDIFLNCQFPLVKQKMAGLSVYDNLYCVKDGEIRRAFRPAPTEQKPLPNRTLETMKSDKCL